MNLIYIEVDSKEIDIIEPLWIKLRAYHHELSKHFPDRYIESKFKMRKKELLDKSINSHLKIDIVKYRDTEETIGYCISSISDKKNGEVDSIYIEEEYRSIGIGAHLIKRALNWMDEKGVKSKKIVMAVGNEELLSFYQKFDFLPRHIVLEQKD